MFNKLRCAILYVGIVSLFFVERVSAAATSTFVNINVDALNKSTDEASYLLQLAIFQRESIYQLASLNVTYLTIAVTILLAFAGLVYLFNFRPIAKKIDEQEKSLIGMRENNQKDFELLNEKFKVTQATSEAKISNTSSELKKLVQDELSDLRGEFSKTIAKTEEQVKGIESDAREEIKNLKVTAQELEIDQLWSEHYIWDKIPMNEFRTLLSIINRLESYEGSDIFKQGYWRLVFRTLARLTQDEQLLKEIQEEGNEQIDNLIRDLSKISFTDENKDIILLNLQKKLGK
ncbi:hypothetical protein A2372_02605 [Candidatus Wolfebacteria bacterium RIFOXYB1_FULL_54_12]|uniref:Uncharacterized protein n=1 Tax=Candidatus Wolfebacteria bacterium RIFOXYB1_FULL_54_12 TaxID=1802559 RepID=A0A1F8DYW6_9BACT|nr:MAG: hypothetical protein A2372_02605 [Candidatus Wolfebacteria bacterium RIFOXYB1_FULL_54_12]